MSWGAHTEPSPLGVSGRRVLCAAGVGRWRGPDSEPPGAGPCPGPSPAPTLWSGVPLTALPGARTTATLGPGSRPSLHGTGELHRCSVTWAERGPNNHSYISGGAHGVRHGPRSWKSKHVSPDRQDPCLQGALRPHQENGDQACRRCLCVARHWDMRVPKAGGRGDAGPHQV